MISFMLKTDAAKDAAAIGKAASSDGARPILNAIAIEYGPGGSDGNPLVTFTSTDSYILSTRKVTEFFGDDTELGDGGVFLVVAKSFIKAVAECGLKKHGALAIRFTIDTGAAPNTLAVSTLNHSVEHIFKEIEGTFPNWRQLVPDEPVFEGYEGEWPGLNPTYIKRLLDSGGSVSDRPVRFGFAHRADGAQLKPLVYQNANNADWMGLQMPVRL